MITAKIAAVVFVLELAIMAILTTLGFHGGILATCVDATLLTLAASGIVRHWIIGPYVQARDSAEEALRLSEERWKFALEGAGAGVWELEVATGAAYFSSRWREMLGVEEDEPARDLDLWHARIHPDDQEAVLSTMSDFVAGTVSEYRTEHRLRLPSDAWIWVCDRAMIVRRDANGCPSRIIGTHTDITATKRADAALRDMATRDPLTGLFNRRHFLERLDEAHARLARSTTEPASVLMIDIDHFKSINDSHGHAVGDTILAHFAKVCAGCLRKTDSIGRVGGEEFAVILSETRGEAARDFAERLRLRVSEMSVTGGPQAIPLTISIGIASLWASDRNPQDALRRADDALYVAKRTGRNRVEISETELGYYTPAKLVTLVWHSAYECGDPLIDRQHRELFGKANDLLNAVVEEHPTEELAELVRKTIDLIVGHFGDEEALLRRLSYPGLEEHRRAHERLLDQANDLGEKLTRGQLSFGPVFSFLAQDVIARHMLVVDRQFADFVASRSRKGDLTVED